MADGIFASVFLVDEFKLEQENKKNETSLNNWTTFTLFIALFVRTKQPRLPITTRQRTLRTYEIDALQHGNAA